jgi:hypothetical protein
VKRLLLALLLIVAATAAAAQAPVVVPNVLIRDENTGFWIISGGPQLPTGGAARITNDAKFLLYNDGWYRWDGTDWVRDTGGTFEPEIDGGAVTFLTEGSTVTGATNQGLRRGLVHIFDTLATDYDTAALQIESILTTDPSPTLIKKTGLHIKSYHPPDNGGDSSGALIVETGGGNGLAVYQVHLLRPTGFTDYSGTTSQGAMEIGTTGGSHGLLAISGPQTWGAHSNISNAIWVRLDNGDAKGIVITPSQASDAFDVMDDRVAIGTGRHLVNQADTDATWHVLLSGRQWAVGPLVVGVDDGATTADIDVRKVSATATVQATRTTTNPVGVVMSAQADQGIIGTVTDDVLDFIQNNTTRARFAAATGYFYVGGNTAAHSPLQVGGALATAVRAESADYTLAATDSFLLCDSSGGARVITLPTAVGIAGRHYTIKRIGANSCTVDGAGAETIDDAANYALPLTLSAVNLISDGDEWYITAIY